MGIADVDIPKSVLSASEVKSRGTSSPTMRCVLAVVSMVGFFFLSIISIADAPSVLLFTFQLTNITRCA